MSDRTCYKCGKVFQYPTRLRRHQKQRKSCALIIEQEDLPKGDQSKTHKCRFCGRRFSTYTNMRRHIREICKIAPNKKNGNVGMEILYEHIIKKQQEQITQLTTLVENLATRENQQTKEIKSVVVQGNYNSTIQTHLEQHNTFNINAFGQENVDHINYMTIYRILNEIQPRLEVQEAAKAVLLEVLSQIYGNSEHPENFSCYLPNKRTDDTMVHGAKGWEIRTFQRTCQPMIKKGLDVLFEFGNQPLPDKPGCENMKPFDKFEKIYKTLGESEKKYPNEMKKDVRAVLLQIRSLLQKRNRGKLPASGDE